MKSMRTLYRPVIGEGDGGGMHFAHDWILGLLSFLLPQDLYFTVVDGEASESVAKLP